jgi:hypothetical protein
MGAKIALMDDRMAKATKMTRNKELVNIAAIVLIDTMAVAAANLAGAGVPAVFIAGVGAGAVIAYARMTNQTLKRKK